VSRPAAAAGDDDVLIDDGEATDTCGRPACKVHRVLHTRTEASYAAGPHCCPGLSLSAP